MSVAFDTRGTAGALALTSAAPTLSWSHTCLGVNRLLCIFIDWDENDGTNLTFGGASVTGVTYNGIALTFHSLSASNGNSELWFLRAPILNSSSTVTVTWSISVGTFVNAKTWSVSTSGVSQSAPLSTAVTNSGSSNSISTNLTGVSTSNLVLDSAKARAAPVYTVGAGQTGASGANTGAPGINQMSGCTSYETSAVGTVTMSWSLTSVRDWCHLVVEVLEAKLRDPIQGNVVPVKR